MTDSLCVDKTCQITNMRLSCAQHIAHREKPSTGTSKQHMSQHKAGQGWRLEPALACSVPNVASPRSRGAVQLSGATRAAAKCSNTLHPAASCLRCCLSLLFLVALIVTEKEEGKHPEEAPKRHARRGPGIAASMHACVPPLVTCLHATQTSASKQQETAARVSRDSRGCEGPRLLGCAGARHGSIAGARHGNQRGESTWQTCSWTWPFAPASGLAP